MSHRPLNLAEVGKDHALVHFFAVLAAVEEIDLVMRLLTSGIASFLPVDAVVLGFSNGETNTFRIEVWDQGAASQLESTTAECGVLASRVCRVVEEHGYPQHKSLALVHLGKSIGHLAVARQEPAQLNPEEESRLTTLQTLTSLLLAKHVADEALRHSREWMRVTLTSIGDAVMTTDAEGRVTFLNAVAEALSGWSTEEALGKPIQQVFRIINERSGEPGTDIVKLALRERRVVELADDSALLARHGGRIPIEDSAAPIRDAKGNIIGVVLVFHDVTERRRAQAALRESEQRVRLKLESILSPEGDIGSLDLADVIDSPVLQALMEEFYALTGLPTAIIDMKGKVLVGVGWEDVCTQFHRVNPESCAHCVESDVELSDGVPPGEFKLYHCKNHMWDVATPITVGDKHVGNLFSGQFFFEGEALDYELFRGQARRYGFEEEAYLAALGRVKRLKRETLTAGMKYLTRLADLISKLSYSSLKLARLLAERERAQQALIRSEKLVSVGRLAATIAHEINNPLEAVTNVLYLLANDASLPAHSREMADIADREVRRAAQIARRTLGFYREPNARMEVAIPELFKELFPAYDSQMRYKNVRLQVRFADEKATVIGNSGELRQLFSNLLANSVDAVPESGSVHIRVGKPAAAGSGTPTLRITVADTGSGIPRENLKRIFEPFFTTKKDVGTGLGLWISEEIVKKHGGTIRVRSRPGSGTVFSVRLPAALALSVRAGA